MHKFVESTYEALATSLEDAVPAHPALKPIAADFRNTLRRYSIAQPGSRALYASNLIRSLIALVSFVESAPAVERPQILDQLRTKALTRLSRHLQTESALFANSSLSPVREIPIPVSQNKRPSFWYSQLFDITIATAHTEAAVVSETERRLALWFPKADLMGMEFCVRPPAA